LDDHEDDREMPIRTRTDRVNASESPAIPAGGRVLVVMAKPLVRGAVKTRLAQELGPDEALEVYAGLLEGTLRQAERLGGVTLALAEAAPRDAGSARGVAVGGGRDGAGSGGGPDGAAPDDPLAGRDGRWLRLAQRGPTLGERLAGVFEDVFAAGAGAVAIVNSDSPSIPLEYLEQALGALHGDGVDAAGERRDDAGRLVLGPAADGGYYLIGAARKTWARRREAITGLLAASPMSTASLLSHTLRAAKARSLDVTQLPLWIDIDRAGDLGTLARLSGDAPLRGEPLQGLREIYLHVTHRCERDCVHCYNRNAVWDPGELTTEEWIDAIDQCVALGAGSFVFIGGDPLLRPDFVRLLDHITGAQGARVRFFFNSFVSADDAAALARAGRGRLTPLASIDGPLAINDELRGPGSYGDVMASIANLHAAGLEPVANTVLVRPVLPGLVQLARELHEAGVRRLHLILPHQQGAVAESCTALEATDDEGIGAGQHATRGRLDLVPTGEELLVAVRELLTAAAEIGIAVDNLSSWRRRIGARNDLCAAGCRDLAIDPYGRVHACVITAGDPAFNAGSLRERSLEQIWRASGSLRLLRAARARDRAECLVCPVVDVCGGECWVQAHYAARAHDEVAGYQAAFPYCDLVRPMLLGLTAEAEAAREAAAPAAGDCVVVGACGGQSAAGAEDYALFDCI
jgi:radical SAM protein with 4Fe4S-binding SPASM domain